MGRTLEVSSRPTARRVPLYYRRGHSGSTWRGVARLSAPSQRRGAPRFEARQHHAAKLMDFGLAKQAVASATALVGKSQPVTPHGLCFLRLESVSSEYSCLVHCRNSPSA